MMPDDTTVLDLYRLMWTVRKLEEKVGELVTNARISCSGHFGLGQEAVGVGVAGALEQTDYIFGTHRGFAEYVGKGMTPREILCEYYGRATSLTRGRAGQHLLKTEIGIMPLPSSLGSEFGMAVGCALSSARLETGRVTVNIFGEGTASQSDCIPSIEMAVLWNLPIVFVCNNNQYVELDSHRNVSPSMDVAPRASAYNMPFEIEDGNDIEAVWSLTRSAVKRARNGDGPTFLEYKTYRRGTHYTGDPGGYQPAEEIEFWEKRDPIDRCRVALSKRGVLTSDIEATMLEEIDAIIDEAVTYAEESAYPGIDDLSYDPFAPASNPTVGETDSPPSYSQKEEHNDESK